MAVSGLFLLSYGVFRFFVEFYRVPDAHLNYLALGWVTMGQVLTAPMIIIGLFMLIFSYNKQSRRKKV
jgi:phosphatidylglycerol:prolipoprotein diacylglycerol transferase